MRRSSIWPALPVLAAVVLFADSVCSQVFDFPSPAPAQLGAKHQLWATHYYVYPAAYAPSGVPLLDAKGNRLDAILSEKDWCLGGIEGTFVITMPDGHTKTYNYANAKGPLQADCAKFFTKPPAWVSTLNRQTFSPTEYRYGTGASGIKLVPFRTIAVDPKTIPLRSLVYVPAAVGTPIPLATGGTAKHDGYFLAGDTGGAIKGEHIDIFTGTSRYRVFAKVARASQPQTYSEAYIVNSEVIRSKLLAEHRR